MVDNSISIAISLAVIAATGVFICFKRCKRYKVDEARTVWIIGASSGIGKELAKKYACEGKNVILSSRNSSKLEEVSEEVSKLSGEMISCFPVLTVDIEEDETFSDSVKKAESFFGSVDIVIISSGLGIRAFNEETSSTVEKKMIQTNYTGPILLAKEILPYMRSHHSGSIVFISSIQGILSIPARSSYSAAKHALQGYCESLRAEEFENGINILTVSPAYVNTNHSVNAIRGDGSRYNQVDMNTKKGMDPKDLAEMIVEAVIDRRGSLIVAPLWMKLVIVLKCIFPETIASFMNRKARKARS